MVQIEASASHARDGGSFALTHRPSPRHRQATLDQSEHNDLAGWFGADWKFTNPAATRVVPTTMDDSTDGHGRKLHHGFPGSKQISRIYSVRARDSTPDEPGRSFFGNNLGKLLAPDPDRCAVTKSIVRARGGMAA